jgi:hypothetical protein
MKFITKIEGTDLRFRLEPVGGNEYHIILEKKFKKYIFLTKWERVKKHVQTIDSDRGDAMHKYLKFTKALYEAYKIEDENGVSNHPNFVAGFPSTVNFSQE